jgi:hypothetical protein
MAAKLCSNCGGRGEVPFVGLGTTGVLPFMDRTEIRWFECSDCNGLGYISLKKMKKTDP